MKSYISLIIINILISSIITQTQNDDEIPDNFDSRQKWPNCIPKIYDQGTCDSCYAISTATTFSARYCIRNNLAKIINFSPQDLLNCLNGCNGEFPDVTWEYVNKNGTTTDECQAYQSIQKECSTECDSTNVPFKKYYSGEIKFMEDENSIKKEIMTNGPVTSMMNIYNDYKDYKSGIYNHSTEDQNILAFHAISLIGWGIENNVKFWIVQDSRGTSHGENGYMRIKVGDESGAGATAFCDEVENNTSDSDEENNKTKNYFEKLFLNNFLILIIIILIIILLLK